MFSHIDDSFTYTNLQNYVTFLFDRYLDACIQENIQLLEKFNPSILASFQNLSEEEKQSYWGCSFKTFLSDIIEGKALTRNIATGNLWRKDALDMISKDQISGSDILIIYSTRKQVLINLLSSYTDNCEKMLDVVREIEIFFLQLEHHSIETYVEIQKELIVEEKAFSESIFNNTVDGIFAWNHAFTLTAWNAVLERQYNLKKQDVIGKNYFEIFPAYLDSKLAKAMQRVLQGEKVYFPENPYLYKDGYYEMNLIPLKDAHGNIAGGISIVHDITDRKKAEKSILDHREELQSANEVLQVQQEELQQSHNEAVRKKKHLEQSNNALETEIQARIEIEKELKNERNFIKAILDNMREGIVACDNKGKLTFFNEASIGFHKKKPERKSIHEWPTAFNLYYPDGKTPMNPEDVPLYKALQGNQVKDCEMVIASSEGNKYTLSVNGQSLFDGHGNKQGAVVVMHNITKRKIAEREISEKNDALIKTLKKLKTAEDHLRKINGELELRVQMRTDELQAREKELKVALEQSIQLNEIISHREKFLSSIIDQTPISTAIYDAKGNQIRVNDAYNKLFGAADHPQDIHYNILKDESLIQSPQFREIEKVFRQGEMTHFTVDYGFAGQNHASTPTGASATLITTIFPIKDASNQVLNAVVQHEDITERKKAEEALKASEAQLRLITDALPVLIAYVDKQERYRFNNKAYENWFKLSRNDIIGKTVKEVVGEKAYAPLKDQIEKALSGENFYYEASLPYKDAGKKFVAVNYIPHVVNHEVLGYYTLINDISIQKEIQRALEAALQETNDKNEELQKINNDLDNFIYIASHDLKSPIVNLEGLVASLNRKIEQKSNNEEQKILEMIQASIEKFKTTLKNLTEVTKAQKNLEEEKEIVSLRRVIEEVKDEIQTLIVDSGAEIKEEMTVAELFVVPVNLRSILYNLLTNAIKYRKPDTPLQILIRSYKKGSNIVLSVKDNGLGLSKSQQSKLFKMFKRMHSHVEGTGIGLYILKRIAENSGGKVEVDSAENVGTEFRVFFRNN